MRRIAPSVFLLLASSSAQPASFRGIGDLSSGCPFCNGASDISSDGTTVVGKEFFGPDTNPDPTNAGIFATTWDATNGLMSLGDLPGGDLGGQALGVSADGKVVVGSSGSALGDEAFIWDAANGMQSVQMLLASIGLDLTGWTLTEARAASFNGQTIVGIGTNPNGFTKAWIAVIPEPSTALLMGLGLVALR